MSGAILLRSVGVFVLISFCAPGIYAQQSPSYFAPQNILRFADNLYEEGDYLRAAMEYRRYLSSFSPSEVEAGPILLRIGVCYRLGRSEDRALTYFQRVAQEFRDSPLRSEAIIQSSLTWFSLGKYEVSESYLANITFTGEDNQRYQQKKVVLLCASLLMQDKWKESLTYLDSSSSSEADPLSASLKSISYKGTRLAHRSPLVAGFLSAVIPGLGRFYSHRAIDGIYSFFTIGLAGWQAYDGFHKDGFSSFKGWAFGILGSILYVGNIYGSAVSVQIYNVRIRQNLYDEVRLIIRSHF